MRDETQSNPVSGPLFRWAAALIGLLLAAGCSGGGRTLPIPIPFTAEGGFTKRVAILPFQVQSGYVDPRSGRILQQTAIERLQADCPTVRFQAPSDPEFPISVSEIPRLEDGSFDNFELAMVGRRWGLNALMISTLSSVSVDEQEEGFWWFKKLQYYVQVEVRAELLDSETASKLLSHTVNRRVEIDRFDVDMINARNQVELYYFEETLDDIAEEIAEAVCRTIAEQSWKSYVLLVEGGELLIAAGAEAELQTGVLLEIFDSSEVVQAAGARRYILPGPKIGEARVTVVDARVSRAAVVSGSEFRPGQVVRAK
jgi:hypothetical protein